MNDSLQKGIDAFKSGKTEEARKQFSLALDDNKNDEKIWGWVYNVAQNDKERVYCLSQMIRINPNNEKAKGLLAEFNKSDELEPPLEMPKRTSRSTSTIPATSKPVKNSTPLLLTILSIIIFCGCLFFIIPTLSNSSTSVFSSESTITYIVTGTAGNVHVNYTNATGGDDSYDANLPYKKEIKIKKDELIFLTAMPNNFIGKVTCEIWVDGVMVDTKTATNTIVSCSNFLK